MGLDVIQGLMKSLYNYGFTSLSTELLLLPIEHRFVDSL